MEILLYLGISRSVCDEKELPLRLQMLAGGNLEELFSAECSEPLPLVYRITDWYLYDNDDSFDDDKDDADQTSVKLLSCIQHDWTEDDKFARFASMTHLNWLSDGEVDNDDSATVSASEQGFYDVTMLTGGVFSEAQLSSCLSDADKEGMLLHPDLMLEYIMATHHRQRRVAEQLRASDSALQTAATAAEAADDSDEEDKHGKHSREPSFVSSCPQPSKVRPDYFWIREESDKLPDESEGTKCASHLCSCESVSTCSCGSGSIAIDSRRQQSSSDNSVLSSPVSLCSPGMKVIDIAQQLVQEEHTSERPSEHEAKASNRLSIYEMEGISFEPGLVRRTVDLGVDVSASPARTAISRPVSIYETEDISLEPGLVRRTRQEIEQRLVFFLLVFCVNKCFNIVSSASIKLVAWHSGRTSVFGWRTFPVLRLTCS